jgi:hypothetical protein
LHNGLPTAADELPWTITYVIRKRLELDSYYELPKEKRPPDKLIWYGTSEEVEKWFDKVFDRKGNKDDGEAVLMIDPREIE